MTNLNNLQGVPKYVKRQPQVTLWADFHLVPRLCIKHFSLKEDLASFGIVLKT